MDTFFGFDTILPSEGDYELGAGAGEIDSEDEYDALNNETFGEADKGDWEDIHENLVRLSKNEEGYDEFGKDKYLEDDPSDLELNFTKFALDDCEIPQDEVESRIQLDPSVWASPSRSLNKSGNMFNFTPSSAAPPPLIQHQVPPPFPNFSQMPPIKMCTLEDIERNMITQQHKEIQENMKNKENHLKQQQIPPPMNLGAPPGIRNQQMFLPPPPIMNPRMPMFPYNMMPPPFPGPMNNLAMHPGFANMSHLATQIPPPRLPFPMQQQQNFIQNIQTNQFNKRLVQEIQQNHPMLPFNRQSNQQPPQQQQQHNIKQQQHNNGMINNTDEYANLMTHREKQWLISIQLQQLNSDTPYINDFYYTVWKDRMANLRGDRESKAHKDNQMNHPFTQPKGHAQMLLMSSLAKNCGMLNQKNNRERRNSENTNKNNNENKEGGRTYTPLQFENSLGKLQCGSVTAPRKIIDMDCVGNEMSNSSNPTMELSTQRRSKQILLNIEVLYKIVLKMEDLKNPVAVEANLLAKQKREKEKESKMVEMLNNGEGDGTQRLDDQNDEVEPTFDELLAIVMNSLTQDKLSAIMTVRKGKILLRRILILVRDNPCRWTFWCCIFNSIPILLKKDRDDCEGVLFALYTEFERHIQYSDCDHLIKLVDIMSIEKILLFMSSCKFLLSSLITVIFQMEIFHMKSSHSINQADSERWMKFLNAVGAAATKCTRGTVPQHHTIKIDRNNNIVKTISNHFTRFSSVKCDDFLAFITETNNNNSNSNNNNH